MNTLIVDATNIFFTLLQLTHSKTQLAIGNETYCAELILEDLLKFANSQVGHVKETVLCFDKGRSWRRLVKNGGYKSNRDKKTDRVKAEAKMIYAFMDKFIQNIVKHNLFNVVQVDMAEADDSLAILSKHVKGPIVLLSGDIDMAVLVTDRVRHWRKGWVSYPLHYKTEKVTWDSIEDQLQYGVIRGQPKDGVKACVNSLDEHKDFKFGPVSAQALQKDIRDGRLAVSKYLEKFQYRYGDKWVEEFKNNCKRNSVLLDFKYIPKVIKDSVIEQYKDFSAAPDFKGFFMEYNLYALEDKEFMYKSVFGG